MGCWMTAHWKMTSWQLEPMGGMGCGMRVGGLCVISKSGPVHNNKRLIPIPRLLQSGRMLEDPRGRSMEHTHVEQFVTASEIRDHQSFAHRPPALRI